jgi:hypothetical protein
MPASYQPNAPQPFSGDETPDLPAILKDVKQGCAAQDRKLVKARELQDWYDGESEKYIAFRPAEDALSWLTRPKRVSFITRQAVSKLTSHLYKPGPRHRRITAEPAVDAWYNRVAQDIQLNGVLRHADQLATLHGICAIGVYPTGVPARPINYHLFPRQDFLLWTSPDDPRVATAVCTITKVDADTIRYRLWTATHYYTFYKGKSWGYTPGGWNVARFDPGSSGPHPYGVLPFAFVTHQLPTTELETHGLGGLLSKINRALNIDKSNLAHWVHHYARPLGFVLGVGPEWRPKFIEGGFVTLPPRYDNTEAAPIVPEAKYLESSIDIQALRDYIRGEANEALKELDIPLTVDVSAEGGGGARLASGVSIAAQDADLITYAKGRQPLFELHESKLLALVCKIAASPGADSGIDSELLERVASDPSLRLAWPEPSIDLPGPDRDQADQFELVNDLTDPIELLMRRQGLTENEAIEQYRQIQRRKQIAAMLAADPAADLTAQHQSDDGQVSGEGEGLERPDGQGVNAAATPDMGIGPDGPTTATAPPADAQPNVSVTVAVDPQFPIPAAPLILPATPGYGSWGTEA